MSDMDTRRLPKGRAYAYIRDQIVTGGWPAGTRLQPEQIARELGISRMPVRDAISQLDAEGLVTLRLHQGALVTILPPEEIFELYEIRAALEGLAARKAAERITDEDLHELRLQTERLLRSEVELPKWISHHDQFHDFVCEISGQRHLLKEIQRVRTSVQHYLLMFYRDYQKMEMAGDEHRLLIDALATRNGVLAEQAFTHHVLAAGRSAVAHMTARRGGEPMTAPRKGGKIAKAVARAG